MVESSKIYSVSFLARLYSAFKQPSVYSVLLLFVVVVICLIGYLGGDRKLSVSGPDKVFMQRDFSKTPFALMDAFDACVLQAESKLGASLLRSEMLPLSTRYNEKKNTYKVVLDADVGSIQEWTDAHIYCDIDPVKQRVSYYKEIYRGEPSLLSKTMSMLGTFLD